MALFNISAQDLRAQVDGAKASGLAKACSDAESAHGLPAGLLLAVASRETNCRNIVGDGGHGRGFFQIDDRSHAQFLAAQHVGPGGVPPVGPAADYAATTLLAPALATANKLGLAGDGAVKFAAAAYNAGLGGATSGFKEHGNPDANTAHGNYGADVLSRLQFISGLGGEQGQAGAAQHSLLLPGTTGQDVVELKRRLRAWYAKHPPAMPFTDSPTYGPRAVEAVKEFQRRNHLDDDGKVGDATWGALPAVK